MNKNKVKVDLGLNSYEVLIKNGSLKDFAKHCSSLKLGNKVLLITQDKIPLKYLEVLKKSLDKVKFTIFTVSLKTGEEYKNLSSLLQIINCAVKNKFERNDTFVSVGGGVVSDLTGFAASIYYRGVNFISVPTTLLAMVDASVGGKTAINIKEGKNLLGTFYQPKFVLIDPETLKTLPEREFSVGMAEVIKYAFLERNVKVKSENGSFYQYLKKNRNRILSFNRSHIQNVIYHSVKTKALVVSKDEKESSLRAILNFGHTFAHGIEQAYEYQKYTHGEAVSIGMCMAARLAYKLNLISDDYKNDIIDLIKDYGLPTALVDKKKTKQIFNSMLLDKKVKDGKMRFILPTKSIGHVEIVSGIDNALVREVLF